MLRRPHRHGVLSSGAVHKAPGLVGEMPVAKWEALVFSCFVSFIIIFEIWYIIMCF